MVDGFPVIYLEKHADQETYFEAVREYKWACHISAMSVQEHTILYYHLFQGEREPLPKHNDTPLFNI